MGSPPQRCAVDPCDELISPPLRWRVRARRGAPVRRGRPRRPALATRSLAPTPRSRPPRPWAAAAAAARAREQRARVLAARRVGGRGRADALAFAHAAAMGEHCGAPPYPAAAYGGYGGVVSPPPVADPRLLAHHTRGRYRFGARPRRRVGVTDRAPDDDARARAGRASRRRPSCTTIMMTIPAQKKMTKTRRSRGTRATRFHVSSHLVLGNTQYEHFGAVARSSRCGCWPTGG